MKKKNGFSLPLDIYQLISFCLLAINILFPVLVYESMIPASIKLEIGSTFLALSLLTFILGYLCMKSDPTDRAIYIEQAMKKLDKNHESNYKFYCSLCKSRVKEKTKHCGKCNRCVENFDHHCRWLNNCIGRLNYKLFFILLIMALSLMLFNTGIGILFIVDYYQNFEYSFLAQNFQKTSTLYLSFIFIFVVFDIIFSLMLLNLIFFHIWLKICKMSTYEYIISKRNQNMVKQSSKIILKIEDANKIPKEQTKSVSEQNQNLNLNSKENDCNLNQKTYINMYYQEKSSEQATTLNISSIKELLVNQSNQINQNLQAKSIQAPEKPKFKTEDGNSFQVKILSESDIQEQQSAKESEEDTKHENCYQQSRKSSVSTIDCQHISNPSLEKQQNKLSKRLQVKLVTQKIPLNEIHENSSENISVDEFEDQEENFMSKKKQVSITMKNVLGQSNSLNLKGSFNKQSFEQEIEFSDNQNLNLQQNKESLTGREINYQKSQINPNSNQRSETTRNQKGESLTQIFIEFENNKSIN